MIWHHPLTLELLNGRQENTLSTVLGIEFTQIGDDFLVATMPVDDRTRQPRGILHGGASCVLAEGLGSTAANYVVDADTHYCVGLDLNINHIRSVRSGWVQAKTTPYHLGQKTQVWGIELTDGCDRRVAIARLTMAVLAKNAD